VYGALRLPWLKDFAPASDADCPHITLLFAARDEEEKLPGGLAKLAALDYPKLEIIAIDDRSRDSTGSILEEFARTHPRLRVLHVTELPIGWLGKPHALQLGYEHSTGEWLLFTDADVHFAPDALRRAVSLAREREIDHLSLLGDVEMHGFWETTALTFFGMAFQLATDPYRVGNPHSRAHVGVGAFQMVKRATYEAVGTHRRLAMEVVDDMRLGKLIKQAGFRSCVGIAGDAVTVRWHAGLGNIVGGVTKNFFAAAGYNLGLVAFSALGVLLTNVAPFLAIFLAHGWIRAFAAIAVLIALGFHAGVNIVMRASPLYAFTHPLGAAIFCYMLLRSTAVTLWNGGVTWRGTFYPLKELRRGMV
jgi:glycosyltransferase involved in cell wall biosynthesis